MVGADGSTELWRHPNPSLCVYCDLYVKDSRFGVADISQLYARSKAEASTQCSIFRPRASIPGNQSWVVHKSKQNYLSMKT